MTVKFADSFTETARLDGIWFKFDTKDENQRQNIAAKLHMFLHSHIALDAKEHNRSFKVKVFRMDTANLKAILKIGIFGAYLPYVKTFHGSLIAHVDEAHFKSYIYNQNDRAFKHFVTTSLVSQGGRQPTAFGHQLNPNSKKGSGFGMRVGDRNSGYNFIYYKRQNHRIGLELRISGKPCGRRTAIVLDHAVDTGALDTAAWDILYQTLKTAVADEYVRDTLARGVDVSWFEGLTDVEAERLDGPAYTYDFSPIGATSPKTWVTGTLDFLGDEAPE